MPITELQRQQRRTHLGSSDMAALLGVSPFANAYDVWLEKTDRLEDEQKEKKWLGMGTALEPGVIKWAESELGPIRTEDKNGDALFRKAIGFPLGSHADGEIISNEEPVEAKTAGIFGPIIEPYGEPGTDELPDRIIIQCHVHMACWNKEICHVPILLGGKGFVMYHVNLDVELMSIIQDKSLEFWEDFVEKDIPPPDVIPSFAMAKRMKRIPKKTVKIEPVLVVNWQNAKESLKLAKEIKESAEAEMLAALGDAEGGECNLGLLTYLEQSKRYVTASELRDAYPEIYKQLEKVTTFRVPRLKKLKKPKF